MPNSPSLAELLEAAASVIWHQAPTTLRNTALISQLREAAKIERAKEVAMASPATLLEGDPNGID